MSSLPLSALSRLSATLKRETIRLRNRPLLMIFRSETHGILGRTDIVLPQTMGPGSVAGAATSNRLRASITESPEP